MCLANSRFLALLALALILLGACSPAQRVTTQGQGPGGAVHLDCRASGLLHYDSQQDIFVAQCAIDPAATNPTSISDDLYSLRFFRHGQLLNSYSEVAPGLISCGIADEKTSICLRSRKSEEVLKFNLQDLSPPVKIADLERRGVPHLVGMTSDGSAMIWPTDKERWVLTAVPGIGTAQWISDRPVHNAFRTESSLVLFSVEAKALWACSMDEYRHDGVQDLTKCWTRVWGSALSETPVPLGLQPDGELWIQDGNRVVSVKLPTEFSGLSPPPIPKIYDLHTYGVATFSGSAQCPILQTRADGVACLSFVGGAMKASLLWRGKDAYVAFGDNRMTSAYLVLKSGDIVYFRP